MSSVFTFDNVPFEQRLAETIAWCVQRIRETDPKQALRSQEISPQLLAQDRAVLVRSVAEWRSHRMRDVAAAVDRESLHGGRLLVYFPDADLFDGAAEVASRGFFDVHNAPPWDTWIALAEDPREVAVSYRQYLVAWVPPELVARAHGGIMVNPEECIAWLDDADVGARRELERLSR
jgi:hypothetical protein